MVNSNGFMAIIGLSYFGSYIINQFSIQVLNSKLVRKVVGLSLVLLMFIAIFLLQVIQPPDGTTTYSITN
jgi:hypothetical protein